MANFVTSSAVNVFELSELKISRMSKIDCSSRVSPSSSLAPWRLSKLDGRVGVGSGSVPPLPPPPLPPPPELDDQCA